MISEIYLMRHSEPFKVHRGIEISSLNNFINNIKTPLSINGEEMAHLLSNNSEFNNIEEVWSSEYTRCMSTGKYFAHKNNIKVNIDKNFNERVHGVDDYSLIPKDFYIKQSVDLEYKIGTGECGLEVRDRMYKSLSKLIGKRVLIVSHSASIYFLLTKWCSIKNGVLYYNGKLLLDSMDYLDTIKLIFKDKELIDISVIKYA